MISPGTMLVTAKGPMREGDVVRSGDIGDVRLTSLRDDNKMCLVVTCNRCSAKAEIPDSELEDMSEPWEQVWHMAHFENHLYDHEHETEVGKYLPREEQAHGQ